MTTIETPAPLTVTEKREALLYIMLSHTTHFLKRFLKHQQRRNTPQSLEAAEYIKQELQTATAWLQEFKGDHIMQDAFAAPVDEIEAQIMQEVADLWDVWEYMKENGLRVDMGGAFVNVVAWSSWGVLSTDFDTALRQTAEWVRKQGEP